MKNVFITMFLELIWFHPGYFWKLLVWSTPAACSAQKIVKFKSTRKIDINSLKWIFQRSPPNEDDKSAVQARKAAKIVPVKEKSFRSGAETVAQTSDELPSYSKIFKIFWYYEFYLYEQGTVGNECIPTVRTSL